MKKKYYVMFEMCHSINFSSKCFDSFEDARRILEKLREDNDPMLERLAVGYWEEIPFENSGNLKLFHLCCESYKIRK